jgi:carbon monoxide dehydrogenase subunit G
MPFKVEEKFEVQAPVQRVWEYLIDPARVVVCIPGAELLESHDDRTFSGAVKVKVGPVTMSYKGTVKFTEMDEQTHQVRLVGEGRESGGAGSAKVSMLSQVTPLENGSVQVTVNADVDLVGKVIQFGRGMIEEVSRQLFRQFSNCVKQHLEIPDEPQPDQPQVDEPEAGTAAQAAEKPPVTEAKPVSAAPLVMRALWAVVARFFMRLFGKQAG